MGEIWARFLKIGWLTKNLSEMFFSLSFYRQKPFSKIPLAAPSIVPSEATFKRLDLPNSVAGAVYAVGSPMLID